METTLVLFSTAVTFFALLKYANLIGTVILMYPAGKPMFNEELMQKQQSKHYNKVSSNCCMTFVLTKHIMGWPRHHQGATKSDFYTILQIHQKLLLKIS